MQISKYLDIKISRYPGSPNPGTPLSRCGMSANSQSVHSLSYSYTQKTETDVGGVSLVADSEIVMVDGTSWDESFEQDRSWDDSGATISGIWGTP